MKWRSHGQKRPSGFTVCHIKQADPRLCLCETYVTALQILLEIGIDGTEPWGSHMTDQNSWFEPVSLLSRCSLNEGLLWIWADRVPVLNAYREQNASTVCKIGNANA